MKKSQKKNTHFVLKNRKATFNYEIINEYSAGIVLKGFEVKAIKQGRASLVDAYCYFKSNELFTKGLRIGVVGEEPTANSSPPSYKLLLNKLELARLKKSKKEKGYTLIPLRIFCNNRQFLKLVIGLARGKKQYDKRAEIKKQGVQRMIERAVKEKI